MKSLIFMASPNKNGNTQAMLDTFLKGLKGEVHIIYSYDVNVKPCIDCKFCYTHEGECSLKDDMTSIYKRINECDNIIVFSPMYFASYPGTFKNIIDRTQVYWSKTYILKYKDSNKSKKGMLFLNAGSEWKDMFKPMENIFKYFIKSINGDITEKLYVSDTDNNPVENNPRIFEKIYKIASNI
ncbi:flavodoxin family protein [Clostridium ganghwense]|uniref:Flavodoxin family protein n=1 Tax=Clostridium ganghwense TaxID=312089 RepID=A0ABT4CP41_9CLOT|nr:flavodoxin family protein [Clostridium ganghwense]MCY6370819.1 flavodoxin family protein [Clostridium ganghwense]